MGVDGFTLQAFSADRSRPSRFTAIVKFESFRLLSRPNRGPKLMHRPQARLRQHRQRGHFPAAGRTMSGSVGRDRSYRHRERRRFTLARNRARCFAEQMSRRVNAIQSNLYPRAWQVAQTTKSDKPAAALQRVARPKYNSRSLGGWGSRHSIGRARQRSWWARSPRHRDRAPRLCDWLLSKPKLQCRAVLSRSCPFEGGSKRATHAFGSPLSCS
jgi:hypothetical protein